MNVHRTVHTPAMNILLCAAHTSRKTINYLTLRRPHKEKREIYISADGEKTRAREFNAIESQHTRVDRNKMTYLELDNSVPYGGAVSRAANIPNVCC